MCIIAIKKIGVPMPDDQTIENMWECNSDGAGYMIATGKKVIIRKGFMNLPSFMASIRSHGSLIDKAVVMHFRIATHGGVRPECCHPFPLTDEVDRLQKLKCKSAFGVAHNGVVNGMATDNKIGISDTMAYIMDVISPLSELCDVTENWRARSIIEATAGSKFVVLRKDGRIATFGSFVEDGGVLYSNDSYKGWQLSRYYYPSGAFSYRKTKGTTTEKWPLQFAACEWCPESYDCQKYGPYCYTEDMAIESAFASAA